MGEAPCPTIITGCLTLICPPKLLPPDKVRDISGTNDRRVIADIVHVIRNGSGQCDVPTEYSPRTKPSATASCGGAGPASPTARSLGGGGPGNRHGDDRHHPSEGSPHRRRPAKKGFPHRRIGRTPERVPIIQI